MSRSIVLVSDGFIEAESDVFDYVREQRDDVNVFAFGIGSSVNRFLIEGVAKAGLGEPFIVTEPDARGGGGCAAAPLHRHARAHRDRREVRGIRRLRCGAGDGSRSVREPPDRRLRQMARQGRGIDRDFGDDRRRRVSHVDSRLAGEHPCEPWRAALSLGANPHRHAVGLRAVDVREERVREITSLGLAYSLLTRYTSFVAVQEIVRNAEGADDVDQPLPLPEGVSDLAVGITAGPEPDVMWVTAMARRSSPVEPLLRMRRRSSREQESRESRREDQGSDADRRRCLIAWGLKRHYADARADDLGWILSPTARLVGATPGATFVMQPGEGYFSRERLFLIEKSCAGVNFMIAAFAMLAVALTHRARSGVVRRRACWA